MSKGDPMLLKQKVTWLEMYVGSTFCSGRKLSSFYTILVSEGRLGFVGLNRFWVKCTVCFHWALLSSATY